MTLKQRHAAALDALRILMDALDAPPDGGGRPGALYPWLEEEKKPARAVLAAEKDGMARRQPQAIKVIEGTIFPDDVDVQDSGRSLVCYVTEKNGAKEGMFVRLQSWNIGSQSHPEIGKFIGRKVRITVEALGCPD
jgi:hypothetical protein